MKSLVSFSLIALTCFPLMGQAAGFSDVVSIKSIQIEGDAFALVILNAPGANPDGCGNPQLALVRATDKYYQSTLGLLMTAYALGSTVKFYYTGCYSTAWGYTVPIIWSTVINP
jgi:hypothetical protein